MSRPDEFFVVLDEEYGCRLWFWAPEMTPQALESWWRSVDAAPPDGAPLFFDTRNLPGQRIRASWDERDAARRSGEHYYAHAHWDDDSYLRRPDGATILHRGHTDPGACGAEE